LNGLANFFVNLTSAGGSIFLLALFTLLLVVINIALIHFPDAVSASMKTTFANLLMGFSGALLGALSSRADPPASPKPDPGQTATESVVKTSTVTELPK
jgi:hypothetical protein